MYYHFLRIANFTKRQRTSPHAKSRIQSSFLCTGAGFGAVKNCDKFAGRLPAFVHEETQGLPADFLRQMRATKYCLFKMSWGQLGGASCGGLWEVEELVGKRKDEEALTFRDLRASAHGVHTSLGSFLGSYHVYRAISSRVGKTFFVFVWFYGSTKCFFSRNKNVFFERVRWASPSVPARAPFWGLCR